jgi:predicted AlkP superfamily pyrophosphatase or phosphodiesterase
MPLPPRTLATALLALALAAGCSTIAPRDTEPAPVVLISLDGFRAGDLDRGLTPNLARIGHGGVRAEWMTPSYPSLTFPNHYTVVTGLRPDRHGIVHNTMHDEALGTFKLGDAAQVGDGRWWGGEPIWVGAERVGLPTAAMFWPGTEAEIDGVRPTRWYPYDGAVPGEARVDRVLGWLAEDASTRPRFATLYFDTLDKASHEHGPDSPEAREAIVELDRMIGRLVDGLDARGQLDAVNLVIVSDHGMTPVLPGQVVAVEDMVDPDDVDVVTSGQSVGFEPKPGRTVAAEAQLLGRHERYECWRKGELPARWHYGRHPRVPAIVCQMDDGWDARWRSSVARHRAGGTRGSHGFDPLLPSMRAIFLARGPGFREGVRVPAIENVDVYPALARLVGIEPAPNDGDARALEGALEAGR